MFFKKSKKIKEHEKVIKEQQKLIESFSEEKNLCFRDINTLLKFIDYGQISVVPGSKFFHKCTECIATGEHRFKKENCELYAVEKNCFLVNNSFLGTPPLEDSGAMWRKMEKDFELKDKEFKPREIKKINLKRVNKKYLDADGRPTWYFKNISSFKLTITDLLEEFSPIGKGQIIDLLCHATQKEIIKSEELKILLEGTEVNEPFLIRLPEEEYLLEIEKLLKLNRKLPK